MSVSPQVVVVGSLMQDLLFNCDQFPLGGQTIIARLDSGQGGKGSNQAVASGRTGVPTLFVGAAGPDSFARQTRAFYRREGIGCRLVEKPGHASGTAVILVNRHGQNQIVIEPGANAHLQPADLPVAALRRAKVVLTQFETSLAITAHALDLARKAGATTVLNPAPMRSDFRASLLKSVDILIPNETEFAALIRQLPAIGVKKFSEKKLLAMSGTALHALCRKVGVPTVIVTLGQRGCFVSESSGHLLIPAHRGIKVVDTTGAGDAFCGGFAAGLVRSAGNIPVAARFGNAVAALSVTRPGTAKAMPTQAEIRRFLAGKSPKETIA